MLKNAHLSIFQGENRFIESICQTIFTVPELLDLLNDKKVDSNLKKPFLRFLLWVYMNTAGGMIESGAGDLPHDPYVHPIYSYYHSLHLLGVFFRRVACNQPPY